MKRLRRIRNQHPENKTNLSLLADKVMLIVIAVGFLCMLYGFVVDGDDWQTRIFCSLCAVILARMFVNFKKICNINLDIRFWNYFSARSHWKDYKKRRGM